MAKLSFDTLLFAIGLWLEYEKNTILFIGGKTVHNFKKKYGQNFITDLRLLEAIAADSGVKNDSTVVEIGAGLGSLTEVLAKRAKRVISFEIDAELVKPLQALGEKYPNIEFVFGDFLQFDLASLNLRDFIVVANLPYYITTVIISRLLQLQPKSITVMVQKEVAERLSSKPNVKSYGAMSVICQHQARVVITRLVAREMFTPAPEVDSAVIRLDLNGKEFNEEFNSFVFSCFSMKRKTLANNLAKVGGIGNARAIEIVKTFELPEGARAENVDAETFFKLFEYFKKNGII